MAHFHPPFIASSSLNRLEALLQGYRPGRFPRRVLPAMAHFHPTFIGSSSLNRLEALLRRYIPGSVRGAALTLLHRPVGPVGYSCVARLSRHCRDAGLRQSSASDVTGNV